MCGIIGYLGGRPLVPVLVDGLKKLEYRGYDSAGLAVVDDGAIRVRRVEGKIRALENSLAEEPLRGAYGVGHTRWATHGRPCEENAHPHRDCSGTIAVVHNGIVENYLDLKRRLRAEGHRFATETDTEVIAHLLEKHFQGSLEEAARRAAREIAGASTFACVSPRDPGRIVAFRNGPPAVVGFGPGELILSSDVNPVLASTREVVFLRDGEIAVLSAAGAAFSGLDGAPLEKRPETLAWSAQMAEKNGFRHFMLKEIHEQPEVVRDTLAGRISLDDGRARLDEIGPAALEGLRAARRVLALACGTSYHAALVGKHLFESLAGLPVEVEYASEFRARDLPPGPDTLVLAISQSGETADTLAAVRACRGLGRGVLAVTNAPGSTLAREADGVLLTHAGPEIGVAATKTFTAQLTALALTALLAAGDRGRGGTEEARAVAAELPRVPLRMERALGRARDLERLAHSLLSCSDYLYLGRWVNFPVALEGALKLKEISYTHAEGYAGGEMKHGPIALIDPRMTTLAIVPQDRVYEKMRGNVAEVKARGGRTVAVAFEDDAAIAADVDEVVPVPRVHPLLTPFLAILPLQLFAYFAAAEKGLDVDQPRNLAKSVTVE